MKRRTILRWAAVLGLCGVAACNGRGEHTEAAAMLPDAQVGGVVDSIFPIEEELRRFRADIPGEPSRLSGGSPDREVLVRRFVSALERGDTLAFAELLLDRAEFAYLYYPYTRHTEPPYELSPALLWFQMQNRTSRGLARAITRHGGMPLGYAGHRCDPEPDVAGENRVWTGCVVQRIEASGDTTSLALFGSIVERDGEFKFVSYSNPL